MKARNKWGTLISTSLSCFIAYLDFSIVNTALPAIQRDLPASILELQWIMNIFPIPFCVLVVMMGRMADLYGRRLLCNFGVALFGVSSLCAGLSSNALLLIYFRLFQGISLAAIVPSSMGLISHAFPGSEKGKAIGIWSSIGGVGLAIGPVLGGIFVSLLSWRWIFYINVPFAAIALLLNFLFVEESHSGTDERKLDWKGCALLTVGLTSLVLAVIQGPDWGWASAVTLLLFAIAIVSLIGFCFSEKRSPYPTVPFALLANRSFFSCSLVLFCVLFFNVSSFFLMPLYLQNIRHELPYVVGLMLLPITVSVVVFSPIVGQLMSKISAKALMLIGLFLYFLAGGMQMFFQADSALLYLLGSFVLIGLGWAFARNAATGKGSIFSPASICGRFIGSSLDSSEPWQLRRACYHDHGFSWNL